VPVAGGGRRRERWAVVSRFRGRGLAAGNPNCPGSGSWCLGPTPA